MVRPGKLDGFSRLSLALRVILTAGLAFACVSLERAGQEKEQSSLLVRAAAPVASLSPQHVIAGGPASILSFCHTIVPYLERSGSEDLSSRFYKGAEALVREAKSDSSRGSKWASNAVGLSCAARDGFKPGEGWAWNEYNIGQALLLLGQAEEEPELLRLALIASIGAGRSFEQANEGWGWSLYGAGQSAHALWRLEQFSLYITKTIEVLRQVAGNPAMPAELLAYAKLELSDALIDSFALTGNTEALDEARQHLWSLDAQSGFQDQVRGEMERLETASEPE